MATGSVVRAVLTLNQGATMSVLLGVIMLLAFLIAVFVIFRGVSPIIVLLLLAIVWPLLARPSGTC